MLWRYLKAYALDTGIKLSKLYTWCDTFQVLVAAATAGCLSQLTSFPRIIFRWGAEALHFPLSCYTYLA